MLPLRHLRRTVAASIPCTLLLAAPEAAAQERAIVLRPITITATRLPTPENEVGSTVTVITAANDDRLDQELLRRPKHKASLSATWLPFEKASLTGTAIYVGDSVDSNRNFTVPRQETKPYVLINLSASYDVLENLRIFGRIDNLLDRDYQLPTGFRAPGASAFGGVTARF